MKESRISSFQIKLIGVRFNNQFILLMGTICSPQHPSQKKQTLFSANFTAPLKILSERYTKIIIHLRTTHLFASASDQLLETIERYLSDPLNYNAEDLNLLAVDSVHKLHPLDYNTSTVTAQWLLEACLRQHKFAVEFPIDQLTYEDSYRHYVQFLFICSKSTEVTEVVVPNKMADFMWHSHMQDNELYKADTVRMLGKVLNHRDDYGEEQLKKYEEMTKAKRQKLLRRNQRSGAVSSSGNVGYHYIHYGGGVCGGSHRNENEAEHHHHHHRKSHSGDHKHKDHHHHHHDKEHHKDHHHHHEREISCGGHVAPIVPMVVDNHHHHHHETHETHTNTYDYGQNDTGGGHSACGGGGNDGGGNSACGGGGGNDGGGGSSCGGGCGGGGGD